MRIHELLWDDDNIEHIAKPRVDMDEVEDICFGKNLIEHVGGDKHAVLGQTAEGRYLFVVVAQKGAGSFRVITARDMSETERRRYTKRR